MDVKSAFLNGDLNKEIFMHIPEGVDLKEGEVWLLHKVLYGLKQASREWYCRVSQVQARIKPTALYQQLTKRTR